MSEDYLKYKDYPEGSGGRKLYDLNVLDFRDFLAKYYSKENNEFWSKWMIDYVLPAFDKNTFKRMAENFGYVSVDKHDFRSQDFFYTELFNTNRFSKDICQFVGFMAGAGFFKHYKIELNEWLTIKNWINPFDKSISMNSISEIANMSYGENFIRKQLTQLPFWNR